jgi:hypothetical protein
MGEDNKLKFDKNKLSIESSTNVIIESSITIVGTNTRVPIKIIGDFSNIPDKLHSVYLESLIHQYHKDIVIYNKIDKEPTKCDNIDPWWYKSLFN